MIPDKSTKTLLLVYLLSLPFLAVWEFPVVGTKIQPPELFFLVLLVWVLIKKPFKLGPLLPLDFLILLNLGAFALSALINRGNYLEIVGLVYLFSIYLFFSRFFWQRDHIKWTIKGLTYSAGLATLLGVIGFFAATIFHYDNAWSWSTDRYYPYLGYIGRARAWTTNPNMLFSFLAMVVLLQLGIWLKSRKINIEVKILMLLSAVGLVLTFSKMILAFFIAAMWVWHHSQKVKKRMVSIILFGMALFLFFTLQFGTHFLVTKADQTPWEELQRNAYSDAKPIITIHGHHLLRTNYSINKKAACQAGTTNFPFGVGPGKFNDFVAQQKQIGAYPSFFTNYDPHSTYFGAFAEIGLLGLITVLGLFTGVYFAWRKACKLYATASPWEQGFILGIGGCFILIAIEAISTDVLNFRHYWVVLGLLGMLLRNIIATKSAHQKP